MFLETSHEGLNLNQRFDSKSMSNLKDLGDETKLYSVSPAPLPVQREMDPGYSEKCEPVERVTSCPAELGAVFPNRAYCRGGLTLGKTWTRICQRRY